MVETEDFIWSGVINNNNSINYKIIGGLNKMKKIILGAILLSTVTAVTAGTYWRHTIVTQIEKDMYKEATTGKTIILEPNCGFEGDFLPRVARIYSSNGLIRTAYRIEFVTRPPRSCEVIDVVN